MGILLTVFLIDRVIESKQTRERNKYKIIALRQLHLPLAHHFQTLFNIFKASIDAKPPKNYVNVQDLFDDNYFVQTAFFDFSAEAPVVPSIQWIDHLSHEFRQFKDSLSRTVEKYATYLDSDTIDLVEQIINSDFLAFVQQVPAVRTIDKREGYQRKYNFLAGSGITEMVREYTNLFTQLVEQYNSCAKQDKRIVMSDGLWRNDVSPQLGDSRISSITT